MDTKRILKGIEEIERLVFEWDNDDNVPQIEKDIVLEKIRNIYNQLKFSEMPAAGDTAKWENKAEPATKNEAGALKSEADTDDFSAGMPVAEPEKITQDEPAKAEDNAAPAEWPEPENIFPAAEDCIVESEPRERPENTETVRDNSSQRSMTDKAKLRSLYDDNKYQPLSSTARQKMEDDRFKQPSAQPQKQEAAKDATAGSAHNGIAAEKKVLGEIIASPGAALNEIIGQQTPHMDVAQKIYSQRKVTSIRHSIGVNDRFQLIRDLFGGDSVRYSETIVTLDNFEDIDEAIIYINDNFDWDPDSRSVAYLVELLEHKLGV